MPPRGHWTMSEDNFGCHNLGRAAGISWVEARDIAHSPMNRTDTTTKIPKAPNVSSTRVKKPWLEGWVEEGKPAEKSKSDQECSTRKVREESVRVSSGMKTESGHWMKDVAIFGDHNKNSIREVAGSGAFYMGLRIGE